MSEITARQKDPANLEYLKAFDVQYGTAKQFRTPRLVITYLLLLLSPFIVANNPQLKIVFTVAIGCWAVFALLISNYEKKLIHEAAKIQEEFDTRIFQIEWNSVLTGEHVSTEDITDLSSRYKKKTLDECWYSNLQDMPYPLDVAVCQRSNIVWDWRSRRKYYNFSIAVITVIVAAGILLSVYYKHSLEEYLTLILIPSFTAYILCYKELKEHHDNFTAKQKMETRLNSLLNNAIDKRSKLTAKELRQVQDIIYALRKSTAMVPNWFNNAFSKRFNDMQRKTVNTFIERIKKM